MGDVKSVQRTLRLRHETATRLDSAAASSMESANALADRLLLEALRGLDHPLVQFRTGAAGRREPHLTGTRLKVRDVIATAQGHRGDIAATADYFGIAPALVEAAITYYADFTEEVDRDAEHAHAIADRARERWEKQRALFS